MDPVPSLPTQPPFGPRRPECDWKDIINDFEEIGSQAERGGFCVDESSELVAAFEPLLDKWLDRAGMELLDTLGVDQKVNEKMSAPLKPKLRLRLKSKTGS